MCFLFLWDALQYLRNAYNIILEKKFRQDLELEEN